MLDDNPATVDIVAGGGQQYQRHGDGTAWIYTGTPLTGWDRIDGGRHVVQIVARDQDCGADAATVAVTAAGSRLYELQKDGHILGYGPTDWQLLDDNRATAQILAAGDELFQRHADGSVRVYPGVPLSGWTKIDDDRRCAQIAATPTALYQRRTDGSIHQFIEWAPWTRIGFALLPTYEN